LLIFQACGGRGARRRAVPGGRGATAAAVPPATTTLTGDGVEQATDGT